MRIICVSARLSTWRATDVLLCSCARDDALQRFGHPCLVLVVAPSGALDQQQVHLGTVYRPASVAHGRRGLPPDDQRDGTRNVFSLTLACGTQRVGDVIVTRGRFSEHPRKRSSAPVGRCQQSRGGGSAF